MCPASRAYFITATSPYPSSPLRTAIVNVRRARPELAVTRQQPDVGNLGVVAQKCGDLASAPGPTVNRNRRPGASSRLPLILSFAAAERDPHHANFVLSEPSG
jgi:hypothetical protein